VFQEKIFKKPPNIEVEGIFYPNLKKGERKGKLHIYC